MILSLTTIFGDPDCRHHLGLFPAADQEELEKQLFLKNGKAYLKCLATGKERSAKPEEIVRQLWIKRLMTFYGYDKIRFRVEHPVPFGREIKKADIVLMDAERPTTPFIIVEVKKTKLREGKGQLKSYCNATGAPIGVWSNGLAYEYYHRKDPNYFDKLPEIPTVHQKLSEVLSEKVFMADLVERDREKAQTQSLRELIEEMEDEVLTYEGVNVFEECFKLIFAKLFDESESGEDPNRALQFRNIGTDLEVKERIQALFERALAKWEKVFPDNSKIVLSPAACQICVSYLENRKFLNSNLELVDEAFEYLTSKYRKAEKGQYFTPRYVIDMCVKMLDPKKHETLIDPAAGSAGFTVHSIFHVWRQILADCMFHKATCSPATASQSNVTTTRRRTCSPSISIPIPPALRAV